MLRPPDLSLGLWVNLGQILRRKSRVLRLVKCFRQEIPDSSISTAARRCHPRQEPLASEGLCSRFEFGAGSRRASFRDGPASSPSICPALSTERSSPPSRQPLGSPGPFGCRSPNCRESHEAVPHPSGAPTNAGPPAHAPLIPLMFGRGPPEGGISVPQSTTAVAPRRGKTFTKNSDRFTESQIGEERRGDPGSASAGRPGIRERRRCDGIRLGIRRHDAGRREPAVPARGTPTRKRLP